jgi:hypothetical protein
MAVTISHALGHIKAQLEQHVPAALIDDSCRAVGHVWRARTLGPAMTVHLFLLQLLARVALRGLRHAAGLAVSAQAICAAKARLPRAVLRRLITATATATGAATGAATGGAGAGGDLWHGLRVRLVDAMSFLTQDTAALSRRYGKGCNQRGVSHGYPVPKLLASIDRVSGMILRVIALPAARQERTCLARLLRPLGNGDLVLGDRGLVSFAHVALALQRGIHCLMRLPQCMQVHGRGRGCRRRIGRLGRQDLLVRWQRPAYRRRRHAWMSRRRWAALPAQLTLRQVAFRLQRPGFRPSWAWVITTLSVAEQYPAAAIAELYGQRWQVEVCFRDLKRTLGMGAAAPLSARSVAGVQKEVLAFVLLYNLVRRVMLVAAARQQVAADRISFVDAARWLLWSSSSSSSDDDEGNVRATLIVNPRRHRPSEPRRLKRGRKRFPQLRDSRASARRPAAEVRI